MSPPIPVPSDLAGREVALAPPDGQTEADTELALSITSAETGGVLGTILLHRFSWRSRRCELVCRLDAACDHRGADVEAGRLLLNWAFPALSLLRVEIAAAADDPQAHALAAALGFAREACQIKRDIHQGRRVDVIRYGLLREEWPAPQA